MIISIFGLAGTGKSTAAKLIAEKLGYEFVSTGNIFRKMAQDRGLDLYEFEKLVTLNPEIDKEFDLEIEKFGKNKDNFVIESRLAWHFIPQSIKFKFVCDDSVRIKRVADRDSITFEKAKEKTLFREREHAGRYKKLYKIEDYNSDKNFDFIINTTLIPPDEIVREVYKKLHII